MFPYLSTLSIAPRVRKLPPDMVDRIKAILARLHQAEVIEDMNIHSYRLHALKGSRSGEWSVTVRANGRITFRFEKAMRFTWI